MPTKSKTILAWHFSGEKLRDGRDIPSPGVKLTHDGPMVMCESGLHASLRVLDALNYAPGNIVHRVRCCGEFVRGDDKIVSRERTIIWSLDCEKILRAFARRCALDVVHIWDAPEVVTRYLKTGGENISSAAYSAADSAVNFAARAAANSAAYSAVNFAARAAANSAAYSAADSAAYSAANFAARAAANSAAYSAVNFAARAAANSAAYSAAYFAERFSQNKKLTSMVLIAHRAEVQKCTITK
jgi:hypothetical protein